MGRDGRKVSGKGIAQMIKQAQAKPKQSKGLIGRLGDIPQHIRIIKGLGTTGEHPRLG